MVKRCGADAAIQAGMRAWICAGTHWLAAELSNGVRVLNRNRAFMLAGNQRYYRDAGRAACRERPRLGWFSSRLTYQAKA